MVLTTLITDITNNAGDDDLSNEHTEEDITLTLPTFCTAGHVTHALRPNGTVATTYCFWRTTGQTNTGGHRVGRARIGNDPQNTNFNTMKTICNSSQQIDIKVDVADANNLYYLYTMGYYFPKGM